MEKLRALMRKWVTGVSVVTAEKDGMVHGMTVGSLVSVSIDPPRIVVTLAKQTRTYQMVDATGLFGVTLLAARQKSVAELFSGAIPDHGERMSGIRLKRLSQNVPVLADGLGQMACRVVHRYEMPASTLFVAEVLEIESGEEKKALIYGNRSFHEVEL